MTGEGRTVYCSSKDAALGASSVIHFLPSNNGQLVRQFRAGQAWPVLVLEHTLLAVPDVAASERVPYVLMPDHRVDTIDCSGRG